MDYAFELEDTNKNMVLRHVLNIPYMLRSNILDPLFNKYYSTTYFYQQVSNEHRFIHDMSKPPSSTLARYIYTSKVEWYWKCLLRPLLLRIGAGLAVVMSILIVWSEVRLFHQHFITFVFVILVCLQILKYLHFLPLQITFFSSNPVLSVFAAIVKSAASAHNYLAIEIVCLITICYLCLCTYYTGKF